MSIKNHEGKRRRGHVNGTQTAIYSIYDYAIRKVLFEDPTGLNVSQIARMLPKKLEEVTQSRDFTLSPEMKAKLSTTGKEDLRKTVRKHLTRLYVEGYVRLTDGRFRLRETPESKEFIQSVNKTISSVEPKNWSFPLAEDVAIYRTYLDPPTPDPYRLDGFFADELVEFKNTLFFFERLLVDAIGSSHLKPRFYDASKKTLNMRLLRNGWVSHFGGTNVMIWLFAIDPMKFLELVETPRGQLWAKELLKGEGFWDRVLAKGRRRLNETRALQRKVRKIQALREKQEQENTKIIRSEIP